MAEIWWSISILRSSPYRTLCVSCLLFVCGSLITSNFMCIQLYSTVFNCITGYYWILTTCFWVVHSEAREKLQQSSRRRVLKCQRVRGLYQTWAWNMENGCRKPPKDPQLQSTMARWGVPSFGFGRLCRGLLARPSVENGGKWIESMHKYTEPILYIIIYCHTCNVIKYQNIDYWWLLLYMMLYMMLYDV